MISDDSLIKWRRNVMTKLIAVAKYLIHEYENKTGSYFRDELKLQKMMYFIQRASFALTGKELFPNDFEGWKHGPVLKELRFFFDNDYSDYSQTQVQELLSETDRYVIQCVIDEYRQYDAWYLRNLSHQEQSWIKSRQHLQEFESGNTIIEKSDIMEDAKKVRVYDSLYDMYIDEFDDFNEEVMS